MPHDATTVKQDILLKDAPGQHDTVLLKKYEAPSTADSGYAFDPYEERDHDIARTMMEWLRRQYPGHLWATVSNLHQGVVMFNLPILTGVDEWFVINLRTHDIIDGLRLGAGQLLERYKLKRGAFDLTTFLDAREKHSRLVDRFRKVPE